MQDELPDDIEFLSLDSPKYDDFDESSDTYGDLDTIDEQDFTLDDNEVEDMADWPEGIGPDEAVHIEGVPRSGQRLEARYVVLAYCRLHRSALISPVAPVSFHVHRNRSLGLFDRQYKAPDFASNLLKLLRQDLRVPGWNELGPDTQTSQMSVHKVSGSLTNAVFFISYPRPEAAAAMHIPPSSLPPTVLLRIYGPSSGNLVSRRKELHVLNTLSAVYGIGPAILGTFANGRLEEYFESRALYKEEMRDPRTSRWIARRMRELHRCDLNVMELPPDPSNPPERKASLPFESLSKRNIEYNESGGATSPPHRPHMPGQHDSSHSAPSASSASSVYSLSSSYSSNSGSTQFASPLLTARSSSRPGVSESSAPKKKRSHSLVGSRPTFSLEGQKAKKPKSVIWENIESWTTEARRILKKVDKLEPMYRHRRCDREDVVSDVNPLLAPSLLQEARERLDLPRFQREFKSYKRYIESWEAGKGKSKRVFGMELF